VSSTAIYYYFASKDELFERIKLDALGELDKRLALVDSIRAFVAWCLERPHLARLLMEEFLERGIAAGELEERDDLLLEGSVALAALWGILSQFRTKRVPRRFQDSIDPLVDRYIEIFFGKK
jgi:AcrR family transcriptional regulator